jgi:hypothetical protein
MISLPSVGARESPARPGAVLDDHGGLQRVLQRLPQESRQRVGTAAGRIAYNQLDRGRHLGLGWHDAEESQYGKNRGKQRKAAHELSDELKAMAQMCRTAPRLTTRGGQSRFHLAISRP